MGTNPNKLFYYLYIIGFDAQRHKREDIIYLFIYWVVFVVYIVIFIRIQPNDTNAKTLFIYLFIYGPFLYRIIGIFLQFWTINLYNTRKIKPLQRLCRRPYIINTPSKKLLFKFLKQVGRRPYIINTPSKKLLFKFYLIFLQFII